MDVLSAREEVSGMEPVRRMLRAAMVRSAMPSEREKYSSRAAKMSVVSSGWERNVEARTGGLAHVG